MTKIYKTKPPTSMYVQTFLFALLALSLLRLALLIRENSLVILAIYVISNLALVCVTAWLIIKVARKNNQLEVMNNKIKLNNVEVSIDKIEKIIIQGYFVQSIGVKLYGKKYILNDLHFRFRNSEEKNIEEIKIWADLNGINVTNGRITRWL